MITFREVDNSFLALYDKVSMNVDMCSEYKVKGINNGLGGLVLEEVAVMPYVKDLSIYERATEYEKQFDITNWRFYMAFDEDIRVADAYKHKGIGQRLLDMGVANARKDGYQQMIIECQNNNVPACKFYHKQGAMLSKIDMYAYYSEPEIRDEIQLIWYLDI